MITGAAVAAPGVAATGGGGALQPSAATQGSAAQTVVGCWVFLVTLPSKRSRPHSAAGWADDRGSGFHGGLRLCGRARGLISNRAGVAGHAGDGRRIVAPA
jgi:hypothetical protein